MDIKSTFLNGEIHEEFYIEQPKGFHLKQKPKYVFRHKKELYGLKKTSRAWYSNIYSYLLKYRLADNNLYVKTINSLRKVNRTNKRSMFSMLFEFPKILLIAEGNYQGTSISSQGIFLNAPIMAKKLQTAQLIYHTNNSEPRKYFSREEANLGIIILFLL